MSKASELVRILRLHNQSRVTDIEMLLVRCGQAADLIESQAKAIEEMREALKQCHAALTTLTRPDAIASTTVGAAWAECVAAETAARKILDHSKEGEQG